MGVRRKTSTAIPAAKPSTAPRTGPPTSPPATANRSITSGAAPPIRSTGNRARCKASADRNSNGTRNRGSAVTVSRVGGQAWPGRRRRRSGRGRTQGGRRLPDEDADELEAVEVDDRLDRHLLLQLAGGDLGPPDPPDRDLGREQAPLQAAGDDRLPLRHLGLHADQAERQQVAATRAGDRRRCRRVPARRTPTLEAGSVRSRTVARFSETSAMRPTRPAAVTTGMPAATPVVGAPVDGDGELEVRRRVGDHPGGDAPQVAGEVEPLQGAGAAGAPGWRRPPGWPRPGPPPAPGAAGRSRP